MQQPESYWTLRNESIDKRERRTRAQPRALNPRKATSLLSSETRIYPRRQARVDNIRLSLRLRLCKCTGGGQCLLSSGDCSRDVHVEGDNMIDAKWGYEWNDDAHGDVNRVK